MAYGTGYFGGYADPAGDTFPDVDVYIAFASDPGDDPQVRTDVGADWRSINTSRGRSQELDRFRTGTGTVVLSDHDRDYDPENTAGPYYGQLDPMKRIWVEPTFNGVTYPLFAGFVEQFEHAYAGPREGDATVTIPFSDGMAVLEAADLDTSAFAEEIMADGPVALWRMGEPEGTPYHYDSVGNVDLVSTGAEQGDSLISRSSTDSTLFPLGTGGGQANQFPLTGTPFSVELVYQSTVPSNGILTVAGGVGSGPGLFEGFQLVDGFFTVSTVAGTSASVETLTDVNDGNVHHIVVTAEVSGTLHYYIDGALDDDVPGAVAPGTFAGTYPTMIINHGSVAGATIGGGLDAAYQMVALYDHALTAGRVADHYAAVSTPWNNDLPGERIERVLDAVGWPAADRDIDPGRTTLQSAELSMSALEHVQKVAETEMGLFFIGADGSARFMDRDSQVNRPESAVFGDDPADPDELGFTSMNPVRSVWSIRNDVTVSRSEGTAQRVQDATSIDKYLRRSFTIDGLYNDDDNYSRDYAQFILAEWKDPRRRVPQLVINPLYDPETLFPQVLGREIGEEITLIDRPPGGGAPNSQAFVIEGISHDIRPKSWLTTWSLSPALTDDFFQWDVSEWDSQRWYF